MGANRSKPWKSASAEDIRERYKIGAILGTGSFGQVRECINNSTGESFAVKIIDQNGSLAAWGTTSVARREVELLSELNHPNIVHFIDVYEDSQFMYVVMEKCTGGELFERVVKQKRLRESEVVEFCRQMFSAIEYLHSVQIIHRDIKAENFLYTMDGRVKLVDFGFAVRVNGQKATLSDIVGSAHYIAPEMIGKKYSFPVDMWSAGVLIYLLIMGRYPFDDETDERIFPKITTGTISWVSDVPENPTRVAREFILRLLCPNHALRMTPLEALNDPFLRHKTTSEKSDVVLVPDKITERIANAVVSRVENRRKQLLSSALDRARSTRLYSIEKDFEEGKHVGRRLSKGFSSFSLPTSPSKKSIPKRQATKGLLGLQPSTSTLESVTSAEQPVVKRSRSLPGSHVSFDAKPPDVFVYTEGSSSLTKVASSETRKKHGGKLG
jgi:myosin-light-chain kinase